MYNKALLLAGVAALAAAPAFAAGSMSTDTTARTQAAVSGTAGGTGTTQADTTTTNRTDAATDNAGAVTPVAPSTGSAEAKGMTKSTLKGTDTGASGSAATTTMVKPKMAGTKMRAPDAERHFKEVAAGNVKEIMEQYSPKAVLKWEGGRLNGTYKGKTEIREVWKKFSTDMGRSTFASRDVHVKGNKEHMTVTADVAFRGHMSVPVKYTLVYRDKKIVEEIWKVQPKAHAKM